MTGGIVIVTRNAFLRMAAETILRQCLGHGAVAHERTVEAAAPAMRAGDAVVLLDAALLPECDAAALHAGRVLVVDAGGVGPLPAGLPAIRATFEDSFHVPLLRRTLPRAVECMRRGSASTPTRESGDVSEATPGDDAGTRASPRPDLLLVGASTGGPAPLVELLGALGAVHVPVLVTIHMPADQTAPFAAHLAATSRLPVEEVEADDRLGPGTVAVLRGGRNYRLERAGGTAVLRRSEVEAGPYRPSIDLLLASAVEAGLACDAAILSGMGSDGAAGAAAIERAGGRILVQAPDSCVVPGMPAAALAACRAADAHPPRALADRLRARLGAARPEPAR